MRSRKHDLARPRRAPCARARVLGEIDAVDIECGRHHGVAIVGEDAAEVALGDNADAFRRGLVSSLTLASELSEIAHALSLELTSRRCGVGGAAVFGEIDLDSAQ